MSGESERPKLAEIVWEGDSKEVLRSFPEAVIQNFGFELWQLQQGERPRNYRPLPSIGTGVFELRDQDERGWYRVVYLSRIDDVIYVLHCFEKKSHEMPARDFQKSKQRLKAVKARLAQEKKREKRDTKSRHVTRGNVLDDLGFSTEQATALKFKAQLYQAILKYSEKYSQKELQAILGEPQPRVSELLNGKIANKSIDKLLYYAGRLGIETRAKFVQAHKDIVRSKIEEGYAAAQRGELIDADEVRVRMAGRKRARG